jgi:hypothetical protein
VSEQLPALDKFHEEVYSKLVLEHIVHADNERVLNCIKNILFQLDVLILLIIDDYIFSDAFHGVNISCVHILNEVDLAECALANHFHDEKVL